MLHKCVYACTPVPLRGGCIVQFLYIVKCSPCVVHVGLMIRRWPVFVLYIPFGYTFLLQYTYISTRTSYHTKLEMRSIRMNFPVCPFGSRFVSFRVFCFLSISFANTVRESLAQYRYVWMAYNSLLGYRKSILSSFCSDRDENRSFTTAHNKYKYISIELHTYYY